MDRWCWECLEPREYPWCQECGEPTSDLPVCSVCGKEHDEPNDPCQDCMDKEYD